MTNSSLWVSKHHRVIVAICEHVCSCGAGAGIGIDIRIEEAADCGAIETGAEVIGKTDRGGIEVTAV